MNMTFGLTTVFIKMSPMEKENPYGTKSWADYDVLMAMKGYFQNVKVVRLPLNAMYNTEKASDKNIFSSMSF